MDKMYTKSPLNYIGGKYKLLDQIIPKFPDNVHKFVDIFAGGLDVSINMNANEKFCNDINCHLIDIYKSFQSKSIEEILNYIDEIISIWQLSKINSKGYNDFRDFYNKTKNPLDLYILICYSFNYQIRFNKKHEFNNPFGKNRSWFNPRIRKNLISFHELIKSINFTSMNFKEYDVSFLNKGDFLYADPPYRITTGTYNDGRRGFEGWKLNEDIQLFKMLDGLDSRGVNFALSNVVEHKGLKNEELIEWSKKYQIHNIDYHYNNCNYQNMNKENITKEILVTNY